jgi:hypothetical protein
VERRKFLREATLVIGSSVVGGIVAAVGTAIVSERLKEQHKFDVWIGTETVSILGDELLYSVTIQNSGSVTERNIDGQIDFFGSSKNFHVGIRVTNSWPDHIASSAEVRDVEDPTMQAESYEIETFSVAISRLSSGDWIKIFLDSNEEPSFIMASVQSDATSAMVGWSGGTSSNQPTPAATPGH